MMISGVHHNGCEEVIYIDLANDLFVPVMLKVKACLHVIIAKLIPGG